MDVNPVKALSAHDKSKGNSENVAENIAETESEADSGDNENTITAIEFLDPQYEWSQFDSKKKGKAIIRTEGLVLESKEEEGIMSSVAELPVSGDTFEFDFGATFLNAKLDDNKAIGLILNYRNDRNFQAISVSKNGFQLEECADGAVSVIKRGLAKTDKTCNTLKISYQGGKMTILLNDIELSIVKNMTITSSTFGVFITGKNKALLKDFIFSMPDENADTEQSTSDV